MCLLDVQEIVPDFVQYSGVGGLNRSIHGVIFIRHEGLSVQYISSIERTGFCWWNKYGNCPKGSNKVVELHGG
jgi:hypothetical protein